MKGEVVYLYAFDVANEIVTEKIHEILEDRPVPFEIRIDHTSPQDMPLYTPLSIEPAALEVTLNDAPVRALIHIYEIGVISIVLRTEFEVDSLTQLTPFHQSTFDDGRQCTDVARSLCKAVCKNLNDSMIGRTEIRKPEAYTIFYVKELESEDTNLAAWIENRRPEVAALLTENLPGILSANQVNEVLRVCRSYADTDIAIIDWDAALVIDLDGYAEDTLYVLELANLQLESYQQMDQRLDRYLDQAYEDIKREVSLFGTYNPVIRRLRTMRVDVTKLNDEVTNITKFFGDWHLARIYLGAHERFHLEQWKTSVEERLRQLDTLYSVAHGDATNKRLIWLEVIIVLFFAIDLIGIFFYK